ncbi:threonine/serine ThrE exporter family protein [Micrococcoides hystricis]|uniref:Threonine/serine exporter ThrE family protein n=1 Tax=Micrococcoides hystricis TaxID=1572761 RepID=A0ABV6P8X9_9MICC
MNAEPLEPIPERRDSTDQVPIVPVIQPAATTKPGRKKDRAFRMSRMQRENYFRFPAVPALKKLAESSPPTQAMTILGRLAGTPYANPIAREEAEEDIRSALGFVLDVGESLFRYGATALEVESSAIAITASFNISDVEVDVNNQSLILNYAPMDGSGYTLSRVVRSWSQNYAGLAALHRLVTDIAAGEINHAQARAEFEEITRKPKPFPKWLALPAAGIFAGLFVVYIGGSWLEGGLSFASTLLVMWAIGVLHRSRVPEFFTTMAGGFVATIVAFGLAALAVPVAPSMVVAGGLMMLLPSARFVSAVQDGINGFPLTAAGRFVSASLSYAAMVAGIVAAVVLADTFGAAELNLIEIQPSSLPILGLGAIVMAAAAADGVVEQSEPRLLLPTALVSLAGFFAYTLAIEFGAGPRLTPAIAATVIGAAARAVALRMGAPQLVVAVPAILFLLPGLTIFRSMYSIAMDSGAIVDGLVGMFNASMVIMAIAAGVALGDNIARPLTPSKAIFQRRRRRR